MRRQSNNLKRPTQINATADEDTLYAYARIAGSLGAESRMADCEMTVAGPGGERRYTLGVQDAEWKERRVAAACMQEIQNIAIGVRSPVARAR